MPVIETMSVPMSASTTSRKIAAMRLNPLCALRHIVHVSLLKELHRFGGARRDALYAHRKADDASARIGLRIGEAATARGGYVVCEQRGVRSYRRRGLRGGDAVVPVAAQLAGRRIARVGDRVLHDVKALARRRIGELERGRQRDGVAGTARIRGAVVPIVG